MTARTAVLLGPQRDDVEPGAAHGSSPDGPPHRARRARVVLPIVAGIGVAWLAAIAVHLTGYAQVVHHDTLLGGQDDLHLRVDVPLWLLPVLLLASWQVMTAAMMLPSSLPMIRLFDAVSAGQRGAVRTQLAFVGGYGLVWTLFGALAFAGDALVHELVEAIPPLRSRPWLIPGAVLAVAGAFQLSSLKDRCLDTCRHPAAFLMPRYRRGARAAFALGRAHGWFCLGCCWALMLVMCAAGFADLLWMAGLGALMAYEKIGRHGAAVARVAGIVLLLCAIIVLLHPGWMAAPFAGVE